MLKLQQGTSGFTLVSVLWGLGLLSLFSLAILVNFRSRVLTSSNFVEARKAEALSDAGLNLWRLRLIADPMAFRAQASAVNRTAICVMPDQSLAAVLVEDEGGKIDLNAASALLLERFARGLGVSETDAAGLASAIARFAQPSRDVGSQEQMVQAYKTAGRSFGPKLAPYETTLELDQVLGLESELVRAMLPFLTVHNRQPGFDPRVAPPELVKLISGRSNSEGQSTTIAAIPAEFLAQSQERAYLIHSEVLTPGGGLAARQAIVESIVGSQQVVLREYRRATPRSERQLRQMFRAKTRQRVPPC